MNDKWLQFKNQINDIVDEIAPLKNIKTKYAEQFPWEDKQLHDKRKIRDFYYFESNMENSLLCSNGNFLFL